MRRFVRDKKVIVISVAFLYVIGLLGYLYFHYRSFVSLQIETNRPGKTVIGKVAGDVPGRFTISPKETVIRVFAPGCVESVVTARFPNGGKCRLSFQIRTRPRTANLT